VRTVDAGGVELALHEWGEPESPPLLFWHGAGDAAAQFEQSARVLADEDGLRVLAPDAPGHGGSRPLADDDCRPSRLAGTAAALLDALELPVAIWTGFSWGAAVGCRFAAAYPERTRALVLLEGGFVDFRDVPGDEDRPLAELVAAHGVEGALQWGLRQEPVTDSYDALRERGVPVLLVTDARDHWSERLGFDPVDRLRAAVPQTQVERFETPHGHDLLSHDARNLARLVGDWLASRDLL
jgi:pimeloyl-ACP methyl ester carboxylesterase